MDREPLIPYLLLFIFLGGGAVITFAGKFILLSRRFDGDPILPEQIHFMYDFYLDRMKRVLHLD